MLTRSSVHVGRLYGTAGRLAHLVVPNGWYDWQAGSSGCTARPVWLTLATRERGADSRFERQPGLSKNDEFEETQEMI